MLCFPCLIAIRKPGIDVEFFDHGSPLASSFAALA
jgi:hypothetical protein